MLLVHVSDLHVSYVRMKKKTKKKKNRHAKRYHNICEDIFEKKNLIVINQEKKIYQTKTYIKKVNIFFREKPKKKSK